MLRLLFPVPDIAGRPLSAAISADTTGGLGRRMAQAASGHPGQSGVVPLERGHDALVSRLALIDAAEHSIDAQYYIWHDDTSGLLLLDALLRAAERGVRVRLLLDDNGVPGLDGIMAALDAQDNFEIRLFNPSTVRSPKILGYAFDFPRMNRRMHNKSLMIDGAVAIIGGRNIGDEYFQVGNDQFYVDLDVLGTGAIVPETAKVFDAYWNSRSAHAVKTIISGQGDIAAFRSAVASARSGEAAKAFELGMTSSGRRLIDSGIAFEWTDVKVVADDPVKGQGIAKRDQLMIARLGDILGAIDHKLLLVSAYFVPGKQGTAYFSDLARQGRDVRVLTNALNTTDVLPVHAGYVKYRDQLLKAGIKLYELKLRANGNDESGLQLNPLGLSGASLHAKTFAVDDKRIFIGSFNFDPRSAILNCEMGFLIDSATMARSIGAGFDGPINAVAYRPAIDANGALVWHERLPGGGDATYDSEPGATWFDAIALKIIGLLPVETLL
ncbi:phospholipase D family protein [Mesorhizobium sp. SP-1A]|uniref:phospholipase D family protein n=1 Tax=Mesorhizobium sp. SP-1A TaxID=3077840 RepID=UPI0028F73C11|nr:phospholipase D family protein [Mesorhizobium sp. SP-1A]